MYQQTTHATLLSRLRDPEDHAAWREFDRRYRELILRYCRKRGLQQSDAEDVRQTVMLSMARQLRTFRYSPEQGRFRGYLGRTVQNAIHRLHRSPRPEPRGLSTSGASELAATDDDQLDREWETEWMLHHYRLAMQTVRKSVEPRSTEVFDSLLSGRGIEEVAEDFGMTPAAVHKVKQRVRNRLEKLVAEQIHEEEEPALGPRRPEPS